MFNGANVPDTIPVRLCLDADREIAEVKKQRDLLAAELNKAHACAELLCAALVGAKEEFVKVPNGASHEDVAAINEWHEMATYAIAEWEKMK